MGLHLKNRVRFYVVFLLAVATVSTLSYLSFIRIQDNTTLDDYYAKNAEVIVERLKVTDWGRSSRGRKILSAFRADELRIVVPRLQIVGDKKLYIYNDEILESPSSGAMVRYKGQYTIYIGIYHISELDNEDNIIRYMDYAIPEDEFIHILVDELVSRYWGCIFFVDGEASVQEEQDAWRASEEAVKAYYYDDSYEVLGHSNQYPSYGPHNDEYFEIE